MSDIGYHLDLVREHSNSLADNKYSNLIEEGSIFNEVFRNLQKTKQGNSALQLPESAMDLKGLMGMQ
jgi:hypothetical protein